MEWEFFVADWTNRKTCQLKRMYSFIKMALNNYFMFPLMRFRVSGSSMEPTFGDGDYVLVNKWAYLFSAPKIRDVVVASRDGAFVIKRVVKAVNRKYLLRGDNKRHGSRIWIDKEDIIGKVLLRARG